MSGKLILKAKGIYTQANNKSAVPDGALLTAKNVVIDKDDLVEPRRGYKLFGDLMGTGSNDIAKQLMSYENRLLRHYQTSSSVGYLEYQDSPGSSTFIKSKQLKLLEASSLTSSGTTATFTGVMDHGLSTGEEVTIAGVDETLAGDENYNGTFSIVVTGSNTFEYTMSGSSASSPAPGNPFLVEATANDILEPGTGIKLKSAEVNGNLYVTTNKGVYKLDSHNSTLVPVGVPKALDFEVVLDNTTSSNWFAADEQRGYRIVWGIEDANDNLILGAASSRTFITNPNASTAQAAKLTITIPENITTSHFYQIYRTSGSLDENTAPPEDYQLVYEANPTYAELAAGQLEVIDIQLDLYRGAALYQNETQEGDSQANTQPPFAKDIELYNGMLFYANTKTRHQLSIDLTGLDFLLSTYTITNISVDTNAEVTTSENHNLASGDTVVISGSNSNPSIDGTHVVTVTSPTTFTVPVTTAVSGNNGTVEDINSSLEFSNGVDNFTITFSTTTEDSSIGQAKKFTAGTVAENIEDTARSIIRVINDYDSNTFVTATYVSSPDDPPGKMLIESINLNDGGFTVQADNSVSGGFSAYNPALINETPSVNNEKTNRIYYSKLNEPEAVPALSFFRVGGGDNEIVRIKALRDSLFVFTTEGIYRIVGSTPDQLSLIAFDLTTKIVARESVATLNNQVFLFADQGICTVSDTGVSIVSRQLEDQLLNLVDPDFTNFESATFGINYQSDRKYILFTVDNTSDTYATIAYVYNTITQAWTTWDLSKTCGIVNPYDDKLYLGASDINSIEQERKDFNYKDHADREYDVNITQVSNIIESVEVGTQAIVTASNHGLVNSDVIIIQDCDAVPNIDDTEFSVTVIDDSRFYINTNVTIAGTTGRWRCISRDVPLVIQVDSTAAIHVGDVIEQSLSKTVNDTTYDYEVESEVTAVDSDNLLVTLNRNLKFEIDAAKVIDGYEKEISYVPVHAGNPAFSKHFREAHVMFDDYRGSSINLIFNSEVSRGEETTSLDINLFGNWGMFAWGDLAWGGEPYEDNMRTYIPRNKQRCRLLNVKYKSYIAREKWRLEGIAIYYRDISERTNKA